jgi:hypothetical protein
MTTPNSDTSAIRQATSAEQRGLARLRERYQHDHDLFTNQEWRRLLFLRWLAQTGRLEPEGLAPGPAAPHPDQSEGVDTVTHPPIPHRFGQAIPPHRLSPLARRMTATIGTGTPSAWAGFAWHGPVSQHPPRRMDDLHPARAA